MEFFFPLLMDHCDPANCDSDLVCLNAEEKREARKQQMWRQDGMPSKSRSRRKKSKSIERNNSYSTRDATDDDTARSYYASRFKDDESVRSYDPSRHTVFESETEQTYPTTGTSSRSCDSDDSVWSETEHTKQSVTSHTVTSHTNNRGTHKRLNFTSPKYGILEEAHSEDLSVADSVGAVRIRKDNPAQQQAPISYNYLFDNIRRAAQKVSNATASDPPSDKSMGTARSIRAEDAGSVMLRKGIIRPKNNELLARAILKQRMLAKMQDGPEP